MSIYVEAKNFAPLLYNAFMLKNLLQLQIIGYSVPFFFWNIFLALIPCYLSYKGQKFVQKTPWKTLKKKTKLILVIGFLLWFFFFPNAPYLFTDIRHLVDYCPTPGPLNTCPEKAYLVPLFFTYALVGIPTFYYGLNKMSEILKTLFGQRIGKWFPILMIPTTAIGLMLGLIERFNSWEVVSDPFLILKTALSYVHQPIMLLNLASYTIMMYLIYYFIKKVQ